ncbi:hypothetical protein [Campylobacter sp. RM16187]|uniref:hypothetical protein n=1 Tax=Campylobacter sp. RM16187 TaxID=1660063 RepID=UPI0021B4EC87|nr:hypothetical protein [Campylobacter sp. RM16187]QKG29207.1 hypothetical protein CDOMF_0945 [Campylobacter sp. RM16187]
MTPEERKIYNFGLLKLKEDEVYKWGSRAARLKENLVSLLNEPFNVREFKMVSDDLVEAVTKRDEIKKQIDELRKEI